MPPVLLQRWTDLSLGLIQLHLQLTSAQLRSVGDDGLARLDLVASGSITIGFGSGSSDVGLSRLAARITTRFDQADGGWTPHATAALAPLIVVGPQAAILSTENTRAQLEALLNAQFAAPSGPRWSCLTGCRCPTRVEATIGRPPRLPDPRGRRDGRFRRGHALNSRWGAPTRAL